MARKIYSEDKMKELISRKGDGIDYRKRQGGMFNRMGKK